LGGSPPVTHQKMKFLTLFLCLSFACYDCPAQTSVKNQGEHRDGQTLSTGRSTFSADSGTFESREIYFPLRARAESKEVSVLRPDGVNLLSPLQKRRYEKALLANFLTGFAFSFVLCAGAITAARL
jgi:hypothetical protein